VVGEDVVCDAVEGRFMNGRDLGELRATAQQARIEGAGVLFLTDGSLGDAIALASAVGSWVSDILLGVRIDMATKPHRHPTVLAREMTTFDRVTGGRAVLALMPPFGQATVETISLCRNMWTEGVAVGPGPNYPVAGAINRPLPVRPGGPPIALDLTGGAIPDAAVLALCDQILLSRATPPPAGLPPLIDVCEIREA
jgi:alkanesulfonate monooxygenase SsuD/methylene tetrahydromethanopterin reductase-like flavin-dependent oxidoreductase (luciferase family)